MTSGARPDVDLPPKAVSAIIVVTALLAIAAYWPALFLPLISDDYVQIGLARDYGSPAGWASLATDVLYRCRATSLLVTHAVDRWFGLNPLAYNVTNLLVHILNVWLVFALGRCRVIGYRCSALAAGFYAVYEGHQEAVIWHAALPELLLVFFCLLAVLAAICWLESGQSRFWYLACGSYLLALISKESAVVLPALLLLVLIAHGMPLRAVVWKIVPLGGVAVLYFASIYAARDSHLHFNDAGTFSLTAPFWIAWTRSYGRMLWFWGFVSLLGILRLRWITAPVPLGLAWISVSLLPYSFLTYMPRVPSRHTYLAAVGLSLVVSAFLWTVREGPGRQRPWLVWSLATIVCLHNIGYLWAVKTEAFRQRARPTEQLVDFAATRPGPIVLKCFPYAKEIAERAIEMRLGQRPVLWTADEAPASAASDAAVFCPASGAPAYSLAGIH